MLKNDLSIDHKTVKLVNREHNKVFFVQLNGDKAPQLIQSAEENGWWSVLLRDLYIHEEALKRDTTEFLSSVRGSHVSHPLYLQWLEQVHKEGRFIPSTWAIGVQGTVMKVIT